MKSGITVSVASGKGGTGKTTIATNLALALAGQGKRIAYVDCDVEEPNGHIFLDPEIDHIRPVEVMIPKIDQDRCTCCGICAEICEFNALAVLKARVMVFPSLCHSCGGCFHSCPEKAIEEVPRPVGEIRTGIGRGISFHEGRLNVGEAISPPITRALRKSLDPFDIVLIDAPPGTSCPVIEAVRETDFVILVTEPTPFGLNDLALAVEMVRALKLPFGVIINRSDSGDDRVEKYCQQENIDILMRVPFDRRLAESYATGGVPLADNPDYADCLRAMHRDIGERIANGGTGRYKW